MNRCVLPLVSLGLTSVLCTVASVFRVKSPGGRSRPEIITNSLGMKLALIPAGDFLMGSPETDKAAQADEKPRHKVSPVAALLPGQPHRYHRRVSQLRQGQRLQDRRREGRRRLCLDLSHGRAGVGRRAQLAKDRFTLDGQLPGHERHLGRRPGLLHVVERRGRQELSPAHRGGMGIRLPGGHDDPLVVWGRPRRFAGRGQHPIRRLVRRTCTHCAAATPSFSHRAGRTIPGQPLGFTRHARQRLAMVRGCLLGHLLQGLPRYGPRRPGGDRRAACHPGRHLGWPSDCRSANRFGMDRGSLSLWIGFRVVCEKPDR